MSTTALVIVGIVLLGGSALVVLWLLASHARSSAETAGSGVGETSTPHPATEEPAAGTLGSPVVSVASVISESPHGALDSASPAAAPQSFESCVQRGFGLLARGMHEDGVAEFHGALALIDDREMKVRLHLSLIHI